MRNQQPLVSIVIPVFNRVELIKACVESALSQRYENFEVVIYDNFSTDGTWELLQDFSSKDERLRIFRQKENVGPVDNWHSAITCASGYYIKILFSDDLLYPDFLRQTVQKFDDDVGFVVTSFDMGVDPSNVVEGNDWPAIDGKIKSEIFIEAALKKFGFLVSPGAAMFKTTDVLEVFEKEIPSPSLSNFKSHGAGPDLLIFLKIANKYSNIYKCVESLCFFRFHAGSQTVKMNRSKSGLINSSYMQSRIHFSKSFYPQLIDQMLGKAMFVEFFQNKNWRALSMHWTASLYFENVVFSRLKVFLGFSNAAYYACAEVLRRFTRRRKTS
jgi:glycosyltransferase involved in cell wall biosynthesis